MTPYDNMREIIDYIRDAAKGNELKPYHPLDNLVVLPWQLEILKQWSDKEWDRKYEIIRRRAIYNLAETLK